MGDNIEKKVIAIPVSVTDFLHLPSHPVDIFLGQVDLRENVHIVPYRTNRAAGGNDLSNELGDLVFAHLGTTSDVCNKSV
ncbi:hypothetical protein [Rhizobium sp. AAP116]|uniref:hypothetical protein n=1 Tax=Rhizobium sp. AAP116 TaxID=1523429 RepID=UPI0012E2AC20